MKTHTLVEIAESLFARIHEIDPLIDAKLFVEENTVGPIVEVHGGYAYQYRDVHTHEVETVGPLVDIDVLNRSRENKIAEVVTQMVKGEIAFDVQGFMMVETGEKVTVN